MNIKYFVIICLLFSYVLGLFSLNGQSCYFEKAIGWLDFHSGRKVAIVNDTTYVIGGNDISLTELEWKTFTVFTDKYGNMGNLRKYGESIDGDMAFRDMIPTANGYALVGWIELTTIEPIFYAYLLLITQDGEEVDLFNIGNEEYNTVATTILPSNDGGFLVGGYSIPNPSGYFELWLTKVDSEGNQIWQHTYEGYSKDNIIRGLLPRPDGGYYVTGTINESSTTGDIIILEIDELGGIINEQTYSFGGSDGGGIAITTNDGGMLVAVRIDGDEWRILKFNSSLSIDWQYEEYASGCAGLVQLPDSSYVITGCYDHSDALKLQLNLTKISADGSTTLWNRFYGGPGNDYGYDMTTTPDGGFIISGRTETPGHADVYIVKTNCMGLLTEPQAAFDYTATELTAQFINTSQYVYPDSIDGGHFIWSFGDGTVSSEVSPSHTYQAEGYYTVTLTAVVCSDTSVVSEVVAVGAVGTGHTLQTCASGCVKPFYPNPATQTATMSYDFKNEAQALLQIFDVAGRLVHQHFLEKKGVYNLALEGWTKGIYFYEVRSAKNIFLQEKLVVW